MRVGCANTIFTASDAVTTTCSVGNLRVPRHRFCATTETRKYPRRNHTVHQTQAKARQTVTGVVSLRSSAAVATNSGLQSCLCCQNESGETAGPDEPSSDKASQNIKLSTVHKSQSSAARIAVSAISAYKGLISPLLPNVCRFQPTCSSYGIEAYEQFGAAKGSILLVWRLLRCNPFRGGYQGQYDPPAWPPPGLERLFSSH